MTNSLVFLGTDDELPKNPVNGSTFINGKVVYVFCENKWMVLSINDNCEYCENISIEDLHKIFSGMAESVASIYDVIDPKLNTVFYSTDMNKFYIFGNEGWKQFGTREDCTFCNGTGKTKEMPKLLI